MDLHEELLGIVDALAKQQIEYAICGGIAVAIHGYPRLTKDIDLLVQPEDLDRVRSAVADCGFVIDGGRIPFHLGRPDEQAMHRLSKKVGRQLLVLDLILADRNLKDAWQSRSVFEWMGRRLKVVSREGLAKMKRWAGRKQDLADLEHLGIPASAKRKKR